MSLGKKVGRTEDNKQSTIPRPSSPHLLPPNSLPPLTVELLTSSPSFSIMAVPPANPNSTPPTLTQAQTRALLHTLLSSTPNATRPNTTSPPARSRTAGPQPVQQTTTISIDASTRIMGHFNNVALASPSATEQAAKIEQLLRGVIKSTEPGVPQTNARANANVNVTIQAGVSVMGSKNVVVLDGKRVVGSKETVPGDEALAGRKRRAESEPTDVQTTPGKKVKAES